MASGCDNDPRIEEMENDLANAGWTRRARFIFETPWGAFYRGPHKAWHIWHGGEAEWMAIVKVRRLGRINPRPVEAPSETMVVCDQLPNTPHEKQSGIAHGCLNPRPVGANPKAEPVGRFTHVEAQRESMGVCVHSDKPHVHSPHCTYWRQCPERPVEASAPPCPDCDQARRHAYSDATTPGFFSPKCAKHREGASAPAAPPAPKMRMDAYYYGFYETGVPAIDKILSAVACAGKAYHHTEDWTNQIDPWEPHTGKTPAEWIQDAADAAAEYLCPKAAAPDAELRELRDETGWLIERGGLCLGFCEYRFSWVTFTNEGALRFARKSDAYGFVETMKWESKKWGEILEGVVITEHSWSAIAAREKELEGRK